MKPLLSSFARVLFAGVAAPLVGAALLSGCSTGFAPAAAGPGESATPGAALQGTLFGGQQAIVGAKIYLMEANPGVYKGQSISLMTKGDSSDSIGYYVLTNSTGGFSLSGDYTCTAGTQVYVLGLGGVPIVGGTANSSIAQVAALGACPSAGNFAGTVSFIFINEVSTVAAAYSLAGFAADYLHVGSAATTAGTVGLANAFSTVANLVSLSTGQAYSKTPAVTGYSTASGLSANGVVPQAKLNTLANILAACVNSTTTSSACSTLFTDTTPSGGLSPTTTFDAMLNLAHSPAITSTNTALFGLPTNQAPFTPSLSMAPNDWTVMVQFSAPNTSLLARSTVDAQGNIWIPNSGPGNNTLTKLSTTGVVLSGTTGLTAAGFNQPDAVAVDPQTGVLWVSNLADGVVTKLSSSGTQTTTYSTPNAASYEVFMQGTTAVVPGYSAVTQITSGGTLSSYTASGQHFGATVDPNANVWVGEYSANTVTKVGTSGTSGTAYSGGGLTNPTSTSSDFSGNIFVANVGANKLSEFATGGTAVSTAGYTGGGLAGSYSVRNDGANAVWVGNKNGTISSFSNAGAALSGSLGFTTPSYTSYTANPSATSADSFPSYSVFSLVLDQAGNIWAPDYDGNIYEFVGLAIPPVPKITVLQIRGGGPYVVVTVPTATGAWLVDQDYVGGSFQSSSSTATVNTSLALNPAPQALYQYEHIGNTTYTLPGLTAGNTYTVNLHFNEYYFSTAGSRTFNVSLNGTQVLSNFDIFAAALAQAPLRSGITSGQNVAITRSYTATANSSGQIVIVLTTVINNAKVSGIEIERQ